MSRVRRIPLPATPAGRAALGFVLVAAALNLFVIVVDALAPSPGGRPSSSFATEPAGFAAWAELARRNGRDVSALRRPPGDVALSTPGTVVVLDSPRLAKRDAVALRRFAQRGGRVVAGGEDPSAWLDALAGERAPAWEDSGPRVATRRADAREAAGVERVETAGEGGWGRSGQARVVLASGSTSLLLVQPIGSGSLALLADSSPLQNRLLARADNAALALALTGDGPLVFAEAAHGYDRSRGLAALPARWRWTLGLGLAAALLLMLARGRRFGPPESRRRDLPPPRAAYVDAVAATLARTGRPDAAIAPVRAAALEHLRRRAGREAPDADLVGAAVAAGVDEPDAAALLRPAGTDRDAVAIARAHAQLMSHDTGGQPR